MNSIANNQMSHSCGHIEPLFSPKNPFIIGVIAIYFSPFFFDHPVFTRHMLQIMHPRYVASVKSSLLSGGTSNVMNVYYLNEVNWLN